MDAIEWPDDANLALLGPPPDDGSTSAEGRSAPGREDFAEALRKRVLKMHALTGNLHIGQVGSGEAQPHRRTAAAQRSPRNGPAPHAHAPTRAATPRPTHARARSSAPSPSCACATVRRQG